jgi:catechol 2,3-dioxygenase-like lactoylglutathione lyase family enzyme
VLIDATLVTPRAGEIVGELVLAIKLRTPLKALADVIHPFPARNRVLGAGLEELAAKAAMPGRGSILIHASRNTEVTMSSTQTGNEHTTGIPTAVTVDLKLEVVVVPVSDVDQAKRFYESLGWRLDADFANGDDWRLVQMTPPGSPCSVMFGKGFTTAVPGSAQGTFLVVDDVEAARAELIRLGINVSEVFHFDGNLLRAVGTKGRVPGPDPEGRSYFSFASFSDPDGNSWLLQEVTARLPGRGFSSDVATLTELLQEAEKRHGAYEPTAPKHHWSGWYGAYIVARERGRTPDEAVKEATLEIEGALHAAQT